MKSTLTYDIHNYSIASSPNMPEPKSASKKGSLRVEKYSLRQRQKRKAVEIFADEYASDNSSSQNEPEHSSDAPSAPKQRKSSGGRERMSTAGMPAFANNSSAHIASTKAKAKAAPLSKYRRKTANARERTRMREINSAFENLRQCVPTAITGEEVSSTNEKLTKITTLRLAMKYISLLTEALENPSFKADFLLECQLADDERFGRHEPELMSAEETLTDAQNNKQAPQFEEKSDKKSTKAKNSSKAMGKSGASKAPLYSPTTTARKTSTKRQQKKQKQQKANAASVSISVSTSNSPYEAMCSAASSSPASTAGSLASNSSTSAYVSLLSSTSSPDMHSLHSSTTRSSSYLLESSANSNCIGNQISGQSISDLSSLMLESDGESLHLSEHCVSPIEDNGYGALLGSTAVAAATPTAQNNALDRYNTPQNSSLVPLENPFELSLSLLESSSADSFDFSANQQPSSCLSPLVTYTDAFNPFSDLLHSDFPEHAPLDLFST